MASGAVSRLTNEAAMILTSVYGRKAAVTGRAAATASMARGCPRQSAVGQVA